MVRVWRFFLNTEIRHELFWRNHEISINHLDILLGFNRVRIFYFESRNHVLSWCRNCKCSGLNQLTLPVWSKLILRNEILLYKTLSFIFIDNWSLCIMNILVLLSVLTAFVCIKLFIQTEKLVIWWFKTLSRNTFSVWSTQENAW